MGQTLKLIPVVSSTNNGFRVDYTHLDDMFFTKAVTKSLSNFLFFLGVSAIQAEEPLHKPTRHGYQDQSGDCCASIHEKPQMTSCRVTSCSIASQATIM